MSKQPRHPIRECKCIDTWNQVKTENLEAKPCYLQHCSLSLSTEDHCRLDLVTGYSQGLMTMVLVLEPEKYFVIGLVFNTA